MKITVNNRQVKNPIAKAFIALLVLPVVTLLLAFIFLFLLPTLFFFLVPLLFLTTIIAIIFGRKEGNGKKFE